LLAASACATAPEEEHPVVRMAVFDLNCPRAKLSFTRIAEDMVGATGYVRAKSTLARKLAALTGLRRVGQSRTTAAASTPNTSHDHALIVEGEVEMDADALQEDPAHSGDSRVARTDSR
jgi:hypothetical protein